MKYKIYVTLVVFFLSQILISQIYFEDKASDLGINITGNSSSVLGGVSFFDFDNDGWDDLTFASKDSFPVRFFKNTLGIFVEQTFNITVSGHSKQVLWVDYDNDGDNDLFVTRVDGVNKLYQNNGSFEFLDVTESAGFPTSDVLFTYGASFGDYDNDGFLDVFLSNKDFNYLIPNQLYHNNGNGTFTDVTEIAGISLVGHLSFCSVFFDYDKDGFQDIYISNDNFANTNILYHNNGDGTFTDLSITSGTNIAANAMSTTIGDYNNDGWLDIYVTNTTEGNYLLKNNRDGTFTNVAILTGTIFNSWGWGANFIDADNDTYLDLYVSGRINTTDSGLLPSAFYDCQSNYTYIIPSDAGFNNDYYASFANAIGDLNNDGYSDFVVANQAPDNYTIWKNSGGSNNWLKVKLEGVYSNKNGIGSWIEVFSNGKSIYRYTLCGEAFLGQNSGTEIFGLGSATNVDYVKVTWLSGIVDIINNVTPNQTLTIIENSSSLSSDEFETDKFVIYPNPSTGVVNIKFTYNQNFTLSIFDAIGRKISSKEYDTTVNTLDIKDLSSGVYIFSFTTQNGEFAKKVVIY